MPHVDIFDGRLLVAKTIATVSPPPAPPPPLPKSPLTNLAFEDYQPGLGLLLVIALCGLVCLAGCALCRLRRRREEHCDIELLRWWTRGGELSTVAGPPGSEEGEGGPDAGGSLRTLSGPRGNDAGQPLQRTLSGGPNLPSQRAQVVGASEMAGLGSSSSELEHELDADLAARLRSTAQLRTLPPLGALEPHGRHVHAAELSALGAGALGATELGGGAPELTPRGEAGALPPPSERRQPEANPREALPREAVPREQSLRTAVAPDELRRVGVTPEELLPAEPPWHAGTGRSEDFGWGGGRALSEN